jgi:phenylacetate-coenzyme A ligase PaaK-like adenylate-forming protein
MIPLNQTDLLMGIYSRLPIALQNAALTAVGHYVRRTRYNKAYTDLFDEVVARDSWSEERLREFLDRRVSVFVHHAANTVPYYRELFVREGIDPRSITSVDDLSAIPLLEKHTVQDRLSDFVSEAFSKKQLMPNETSGSTGSGLRFFMTKQAIREQWAVWWRHRLRHGITLGTPAAIFRGIALVPIDQETPPFWRTNAAENQLYVSGNHINEGSAGAIVDELNRLNIPWLHGNPSAISLLASLMIDTGRHLDYQLRWITLGSEQVLDHQRETIEAAFGIKATQHYGVAEAIGNISEDPDGVLYVDEDFAAIEFLASDEPNVAAVVGTNLSNAAFPLIRYKVEDTVEFAGMRDVRGRRRVEKINGRTDDYVLLTNGSKVGRLDFLFKGQRNVREAQIRQSRVGSLTLQIVRGPTYCDEDEEKILSIARARISADTKIEFEYVDAIKRTNRGKLRYVVSSIREGRL